MNTMDSKNHHTELENRDYASWLNGLKQRVRTAQQRAAIRVNTELIQPYWMGQQSVNQLPSC